MTSPTDLVNIALDQIGAEATVTNISPPAPPGSRAAEVAARNYQTQVDATFRSAHWNCARLQATLTLLRAAQGTPENPNGTTLPLPPLPYLYEYAYPSDALKIRFVIPTPQNAAGSPPVMTNVGMSQPPLVSTAMPFVPAIDTDVNGNQINVILTNACKAQAVYTGKIANPDLWDASLRNAVTAVLSAWFVNPLKRNPQLLQERVQIAVGLINAARVSDGNEGITSMDHTPDWFAVRGLGGGWWDGIGWGSAQLGYMASWDSWSAPNGVSY
jgi:hypothetical protein